MGRRPRQDVDPSARTEEAQMRLIGVYLIKALVYPISALIIIFQKGVVAATVLAALVLQLGLAVKRSRRPRH
jgi:hypothetical protein